MLGDRGVRGGDRAEGWGGYKESLCLYGVDAVNLSLTVFG